MLDHALSRAARLFAAASVLALGAGAARADEPPAAAAAPDATQVQEVIVTVQKRAQNKIDVPIALTAYSGDFLQKLGVYDLHDASVYVPGIYVQNQSVNNPGFQIRGITTDDLSPTVDSRISVFQDGVDISRLGGAYVEMFDVNRLEVAKGPQSTLFGRSALIGAISLIQNKADPSAFDWSFKAEGGNYDYNLFQGMVNVPVGDDFAWRFAFDHRGRDGYINNALGGPALNSIDSNAARLGFTWKSGDRINANLILNYERDAPTATSFKNTTFYPANPATGQVLGGLSPYTSAALSAPGGVDGKGLGIRREVGGATGLVDFKINDAFTLHSITAYRKFSGEEIFDPDGFAYPILSAGSDEWQHQMSQEFRLNWNPGGAFSGFVGASYFDEHQGYRLPLVFDERLALGLLTGALNRTNPTTPPAAVYENTALMAQELQGLAAHYGYAGLSSAVAKGIAANLGQHAEESLELTGTDEYDVYGDWSWKATDRLEFDAGLRYSDAHKSVNASSMLDNGRSILGGFIGALETGQPALLTALAAPGAATIPESAGYPVPYFGLQFQPTTAPMTQSFNDSGLTWRLNARYALTPLQSVYASYARGRLPATLSAATPALPAGAPLPGAGVPEFTKAQAETVDSYEVGYKGLLFHRHLEVEGAAYYYEYNHFQTQVLVGSQFLTEDAGSATGYGFEGQADWRFNGYVDAFATYSYSHDRFDNGLYKNNHFRLTPDNAFSLGATFRHPGMGGTFDFTPTYVWRDKVFFDDTNANPALQTGQLITPLVFNEFQNAYGLLNMRAGYAPAHGHWRVELFCANCANTQYLKDAGNTGEDLGLPTYIAGEPATYGVSLTIRR